MCSNYYCSKIVCSYYVSVWLEKKDIWNEGQSERKRSGLFYEHCAPPNFKRKCLYWRIPKCDKDWIIKWKVVHHEVFLFFLVACKRRLSNSNTYVFLSDANPSEKSAVHFRVYQILWFSLNPKIGQWLNYLSIELPKSSNRCNSFGS